MFKIYLSRTVSPGVGISLPATIEEMREAYSLLNGTDTVPLETATAYVESSIPNLRQYLYEVPVTGKDGRTELPGLSCEMDGQPG